VRAPLSFPGVDLEDISPPRRALYGLRQALARYDYAFEARMGDGTFCASVEASMWASAADEWWQDQNSTYATQRRDSHDGPVLEGLRWARNRGVHQLVAVHGWATGPELPRGGLSVTWLPRSAVRRAGRQRPALEAAHDEQLANREVGDTLRAAYRFFSGLDPSLLGSSSPTKGTSEDR
jgi:hypothetical protein